MKEYRSALIGSCSMMYLYAMTMGLLPVALLAMAHSIGFTLTGGGGLTSVGDIILLAVLFLSGFIAAKIGKVFSIILGGWILSFTMLMSGLSHTYYAILGWSLVAGLGKGLIEALLNPLIDEMSIGDGGKAINVVNAFFSIGVCTSALLFGELLNLGLNWRILYFVAAGMSACNTLIFTVLRPKGVHEAAVEPLHLGRIFRSPQSWILGVALFAGGGIEAALIFWTPSYIQLVLGSSVRAGAVGTAIFAGSMAIGRILSGRAAPKYGLWNVIVAMGVLGLIATVGMLFSNSIYLYYGLLIFAGVAVAPDWPSIQSYAVKRMPQFNPTMMMIFLSLFGVPGFAFAIFLIGILGDQFGLQWGFIVVVWLFIQLIICMMLERMLFSDKKGHHTP